MSVRGVLRVVAGGSLGFWCPGCECMHVLTPGWTFNGNYDKPTFSPSVLVRSGHYGERVMPEGADRSCWCTYNAEHPDEPASYRCTICHSFVCDGNIQFLTDCTHALAGRTLALKVPILNS